MPKQSSLSYDDNRQAVLIHSFKKIYNKMKHYRSYPSSGWLFGTMLLFNRCHSDNLYVIIDDITYEFYPSGFISRHSWDKKSVITRKQADEYTNIFKRFKHYLTLTPKPASPPNYISPDDAMYLRGLYEYIWEWLDLHYWNLPYNIGNCIITTERRTARRVSKPFIITFTDSVLPTDIARMVIYDSVTIDYVLTTHRETWSRCSCCMINNASKVYNLRDALSKIHNIIIEGTICTLQQRDERPIPWR